MDHGKNVVFGKYPFQNRAVPQIPLIEYRGRTGDIAENGITPVSTTDMGKAVCDRI